MLIRARVENDFILRIYERKLLTCEVLPFQKVEI